MNLIKDPWLPIIRKNRVREKIAIHQLLNGYKTNPVIDIEAPRPDLKNALYQLLIGIVQVAAMPEDEEEWSDLFGDPYDFEDLSRRILKYEECFEIDSEGPAFMQDYDLADGEEKPISALFIEAPGGKTIKDNQDHFIKRGVVQYIDAYWVAITLYTMQTFAPAGGVGHRVGLRGGGPLTTIVLPVKEYTLWKSIWLNIISAEHVSIIAGNFAHSSIQDIFPWMKSSKISNSKGTELYPEEVHPFHHFFGMPRRIRLKFSKENHKCDLTGEISSILAESFITKNYGNNYDGAWSHPLNAYSYDPKKAEEPPLSVKAQPGGVTYRHWIGLVVESERVIPAQVVRLLSDSIYRRDIVKHVGARLWASGFDMDNMKARCWYESTMPIYSLNPEDVKKISDFVSKFIRATQELSGSIRYAVKYAWFGPPKKSDPQRDLSFIDTSFWQKTESQFYSILDSYINKIRNNESHNDIVEKWGRILRSEAESLFALNALTQQENGLDMKRVVLARQDLEKGISRMFKNLNGLKEED